MRSKKAFLIGLLCGLGWTAAGEANQRPAGSTDKYSEYARKLEATLNEGGQAFFVASLDWDALLNKATQGPTPGAEAMEEFRQGMRKAMSQPSEAPGHFRFLRLREVAGRPRALFRRVNRDALTYREIVLGLDARGAVQIEDAYDQETGQWSSEALRLEWLAFLRKKRPDLLAALGPEESALAESLPQIDTFHELEAAGKRKEALSWLSKLPQEVQDRRMLLLSKIGLAREVDPAVHAQSVERFRRLYPSDPVVELAEFNHFASRQEDGPALAALARLEKALGGDPYLDHLRAQVLFQKKDFRAAKALERKAAQAEPDLPEPYWGLLGMSLEEKNHVETARLLTHMEGRLGIAFKDLRQVEGFGSFVASKEHAEWSKRGALVARTEAVDQPLSDGECLELARKIEVAAAAGDADTVDDLIDWDILLDEVVEGIQLEPSVAAAFRAGAVKSRTFAKEIVAAVEKEGSYRLLRLRRSDGHPHLVFRMLTAGGTLNYHEMRLRRGRNGQPRIEDVYIYAAGQWFSQIMRQLAVPALGEVGKGLVGLRAGESDYVRSIDQIVEIQRLYKAGKAKQAEEIYERLPPAVQDNRTVLLLAIFVKAGLGNEPFAQAVARFRRLYPGDSALPMLELDAYANRGDYDRALEALDAIDKSVGGDAYVGFLRGSILLKKGAKTTAKAAFDDAITAEPGLRQPYFALVEVALGDRDYAETARLLSEIETKLGLQMAPEGAPVFAEFVRSKDYEEWRRVRGRQ